MSEPTGAENTGEGIPAQQGTVPGPTYDNPNEDETAGREDGRPADDEAAEEDVDGDEDTPWGAGTR